MKKVILACLLLVLCVAGGWFYGNRQAEEQKLFQHYQQRYFAAIGNNRAEEFAALAADLKAIVQQNPSEQWQLMYINLLIGQLRDYQQAADIMAKLPIAQQDPALGVTRCLLLERLQQPYQDCYKQVLAQIAEPKNKDLNYWIALSGLKLPYTQQDVENSGLPKESIEYYLKTDRRILLESQFP